MQNKEYLFSIIVPTYNRASFLPNTIESVINQSNANWELIIVDDGSTDNTSTIIQPYIDSDKRIKYIYQDNAERSVARNNGTEHATGLYIICLDSDDLLQEKHLQGLSEFISKNSTPVSLIVSGYKILSERTTELPVFPDFGNNLVEYFFLYPVIPARTCIHIDILKEFKYHPNITIVEDSILFSEISTKYPILRNENQTVYYNLHEDNSINIKNFSAIKRLNGLKIFFKTKTSDNLSVSLKKELIFDCYYKIGLSYKYHNKLSKGSSFFLKAILTNPRGSKIKSATFEFLSCFKIFRIIWKDLK